MILVHFSFVCTTWPRLFYSHFPSCVSRPEQQVKVPPAGLSDFHQITGGLGG